MKKQAKINSVLEKKLEELEYLSESLTFNDDDPNVYRDIELRVIFAKTLLAAEISSRPMETEGEEVSEERLKLACMVKRLNELEDSFKTNQLFGHDNGSLDSNDGEAGSVCSWVNTCHDELGEAEEEKEEEEEKKGDVDAEQWPLFQDASLDVKKEVTFPAVAVKEEVVVREVKEKRRFGFMDLVCFGLMGVIITLLLGYIGDITEEDPFLTPT